MKKGWQITRVIFRLMACYIIIFYVVNMTVLTNAYRQEEMPTLFNVCDTVRVIMNYPLMLLNRSHSINDVVMIFGNGLIWALAIHGLAKLACAVSPRPSEIKDDEV